MKRGQSAVLDALVLLMICSATATLLLYVVTLYGSNTNKQVMGIYNYEYANTALLALRHVTDDSEIKFWQVLKDENHLASVDPLTSIREYFQQNGDANEIFNRLTNSAPGTLLLHFRRADGIASIYCYNLAGFITCQQSDPVAKDAYDTSKPIDKPFSSYAVATAIRDVKEYDWDVFVKIYF